MAFSRDARIFYALKILFKIARLSFKTNIDVAQCFLQKEFYLGQNPFLMTFPGRSLIYLQSWEPLHHHHCLQTKNWLYLKLFFKISMPSQSRHAINMDFSANVSINEPSVQAISFLVIVKYLSSYSHFF